MIIELFENLLTPLVNTIEIVELLNNKHLKYDLGGSMNLK